MPGGAFVESPGDLFDYDNDWLEEAEDKSGSSGSFTLEQQEQTRVGYIPYNKRRDCMRYFLGWSYADAGSPWQLHRELPSPDPDFPWLFADSIRFQGLAVGNNTANLGGEPYYASQFWPGFNLRATKYKTAQVSVGYKSKLYRILGDAAIESPSDEWMRFCFVEGENQLDVLTADGVGQLVFAENNPGPPVTGPPTSSVFGITVRTPFPAPIPVLLAKGNYTINWYYLPFDYLSEDPDVFYPVKILKGLGMVNSQDFIVGDSFPAFPAGTALCKGVKWQVFPWPIAAANEGEILLGVHVQIHLEYFNPPKGVAGSPYVGHNLMPWRGTTGDPTGGKFFYATRGGLTTDPPLLGAYDFNNFFYHVGAPYL